MTAVDFERKLAALENRLFTVERFLRMKFGESESFQNFSGRSQPVPFHQIVGHTIPCDVEEETSSAVNCSSLQTSQLLPAVITNANEETVRKIAAPKRKRRRKATTKFSVVTLLEDRTLDNTPTPIIRNTLEVKSELNAVLLPSDTSDQFLDGDDILKDPLLSNDETVADTIPDEHHLIDISEVKVLLEPDTLEVTPTPLNDPLAVEPDITPHSTVTGRKQKRKRRLVQEHVRRPAIPNWRGKNCPVCKKDLTKFTLPGNRRRHVLECGKSQYKCQYCYSSYKRKGDLRRHLLTCKYKQPQ